MDQYLIDKARARASFDRAADTYDAAAVLQKRVREAMFDRLKLIKISPKTILDAGCGTGQGGFQLQKRFRSAQVFSLDFALGMLQKAHAQQSWLAKVLSQQRLVCGDIESLPIADNSMEMVWSNLALQWCNDLDKCFIEINRILKPDSLLLFSTFGPDTLKELRAASSNDKTHVSRFIDMHDIGDALIRSGFSAPVLDVEHYTLTYDHVSAVMQDLKSIGAHNATQGRSRGLTGKGFFKRLQTQYESFRMDDGKLPATFEVIYGHAWTPIVKQDSHDLGGGVMPIRFRPRKSGA